MQIATNEENDWATSHQKHPVCQSLAGDNEKLTNGWSKYFGTIRIIEKNGHWFLGGNMT